MHIASLLFAASLALAPSSMAKILYRRYDTNTGYFRVPDNYKFTGDCGLKWTSDKYLVLVAPQQYKNGTLKNCGRNVVVRTKFNDTTKSAVAKVVGYCGDCPDRDIDLSASLYDFLAPEGVDPKKTPLMNGTWDWLGVPFNST
ncbi:uncharacterized protein FOMMEDRAFT_161377 [Fomitiporia mediterranea MF3/22]|uniref:uncharacterized protein n=1 Tax=Fomitiporia mediterranea (strain MF3/22) TaxID=694068 RepID=UPI0004408DD3|nr:uncharacterized protein FOMMEDRAFT_161377 [Fomitiporia mediterranea MF3/22]EJC98562.1 hypothetical protein FOMMEDRAFT_161377 [Fomitiporia mediterranea MF3/22]